MTTEQIISKLLEKRGLETPEKQSEFFNPISPENIISPFTSTPAIQLIKQHQNLGHRIVIYGDYDVDGICSTAILWETLYASYKQVSPHIPHRESEGYGLSIKGIDQCLAEGAQLIIAVDNGIVAHEQIAYSQSKGCDILIIDHHEPGETLPQPTGLLHSTTTCAAGLAWLFCRDFLAANGQKPNMEHLSLVALATVCDLIPLLGINRSFVKFGLEQLNHTTRPGLLSLFESAGIRPGQLTAYHASFVIGPRLNSMGRLEHAIDSLRLVCTKDVLKAKQLAQILTTTNQQRQMETELSVNHALAKLVEAPPAGIVVVADTSYHQGVIGLIASKMVEQYYRPSLAISIGEQVSKGSGRSITGFHLTDFLRQHQELFLALGGHAMACGFSLENSKLTQLIELAAQAEIDPTLLIKKQRVDMDLPLAQVSFELVDKLQQLEPFGLGNPQPVFQSSGIVLESKTIGQTGKHLRLKIQDPVTKSIYEAVWFNAPATTFEDTKSVMVSYSLEKSVWNGQDRLQLIVKGLYV